MTLLAIALVVLGVWFPARLVISEMLGWWAYPERQTHVVTMADFRRRKRGRLHSKSTRGRHHIQQGMATAMAQTLLETVCVLLPARAFPEGGHAT